MVVTDENDNDPILAQTEYDLSVREDADVGTVVVTVAATDADVGGNAYLRYSIISGNEDGAFAIDLVSGDLNIARQLDGEKKDTYRLEVEVTDSISPGDRRSATAMIALFAEHFPPPEFEDPHFAAWISEATPVGTLVQQVTAIALHDGNDRTILYRIEQTQESAFGINASGAITVTSNLDRELFATHVLTVFATDFNIPPHTTTFTFTIDLQDENDNAPLFTPNAYYVRVLEEAAVGSGVIAVIANDPDTAERGELTYGLEATNIPFAIDATSGTITTTQLLEGVAGNEFELNVSAADGGTPSKTGSCAVTVVVVRFGSPVFEGYLLAGEMTEASDWDGDAVATTMKESVALGTTVVQLRAVAQHNQSNQAIAYTIVGGNEAGHFQIDSSGVLVTSALLDRESVDSYELAIKATDFGALSKTNIVRVSISIADVNDNDPVFAADAQYAVDVAEAWPVGTEVLSVGATDIDKAANGRVRYAIIEGDVPVCPTTTVSTTPPL